MYRAAGTLPAIVSTALHALGFTADVVAVVDAFHTRDTIAAIHVWYSDEFVEGKRGTQP